jgi:hypothetical protein
MKMMGICSIDLSAIVPSEVERTKKRKEEDFVLLFKG